MYERPSLNTTIADLGVMLAERESTSTTERVKPDQIEFHFEAVNPVITVDKTEYPITDKSLEAFGALLQQPVAGLKRAVKHVDNKVLDDFMNSFVRNTLLKEAKVVSRNGFLEEIDEWSDRRSIEPSDLVRVASKVIDPNAPLARLVDTPQGFAFDAYAPNDFGRGFGGEGKTTTFDGSEVDDITAGGLRWEVNLKQGLVPSVQTFMYRLACTNGMELPTFGEKVDARGQSADEVMAELEAQAEALFSKVEADIAHFYELKSQPVENIERAVVALARERNIPDRSTMAMVRLAAGDDMPDNPSQFDVVNLVTNFANSPSIRRDGGRLLLERAGGSVISDHAARCGHCAQRVE